MVALRGKENQKKSGNQSEKVLGKTRAGEKGRKCFQRQEKRRETTKYFKENYGLSLEIGRRFGAGRFEK